MLVLAVVLAFVQRWLLVLSFLVSLASGLGFTWTEWHDPYVGPAIAAEAGPSYGVHIHAALVLLLLAHFALWVGSSHRLRRNQVRSDNAVPGMAADPKRTLAFAVGLLLITLLAGTSGFGAAPSIWHSPPILVAGLGVLAAAAMWIAASRRGSSEVV